MFTYVSEENVVSIFEDRSYIFLRNVGLTFKGLHGVVSNEMSIFIITAVRNSYFLYVSFFCGKEEEFELRSNHNYIGLQIICEISRAGVSSSFRGVQPVNTAGCRI
jgi:hypothetical protein